MNIRLVFTGFALVLAGCAAGSSDTSGLAASSGDRARSASAPSSTAAPVEARSAPAFASLPDRGDLLGYLPTTPRQVGRSSWHRVDVSEAHALRATVSGSLRMTAPDGQVLDFRHTRQVEYPNGNWSWVGELPDVPGSQAIITFGERAVFGTFRRPGARPLELTVRDGVAWMVERDPAAMRGVDASDDPDFLVAPSAVGRAASGQVSRTTSSATTSTSGPVVDLVLGYTAGYATFHGGQSQANTRLTHLVTVTNDAYTRSRLNAQVRLVRTVQVNYPDNTDNNAALTDLTGSNGESSTTVPASLLPLRQARDQYGGDLVSLVRRFNDPENGGCGLAWLIGGGGTSYATSDAPWGYSIVSDGSDGQYYCREETLAHELGHNMGQNHNAEDSQDSDGAQMTGAHPYSYGYRESSSTGFYTIMAYRAGDSQYSVPYFANPNVVVDGRPAGVANAADNVRSMAQTIPVAATFRAAVLPYVSADHDFNGDGFSDVLWRNSSSGQNTIWLRGNASTSQAVATVSSAAWTVGGVGDFDGDGVSDIFWHNTTYGWNSIWPGADSGRARAAATVSTTWKPVGVGDFNRDGKSDVLWRNSYGNNAIWLSGNGSTAQAISTVANLDWQVAGVGDFNSDGYSDILWRHRREGFNSIWLSGNSATPRPVATVANQDWQVAGIGDFNGDGNSDILWRQRVTGGNAIWLTGNSATGQAINPVTDLNWKIAGVGDFTADGKSDILWRHERTGGNAIWHAGSAADSVALAPASLSWRVEW